MLKHFNLSLSKENNTSVEGKTNSNVSNSHQEMVIFIKSNIIVDASERYAVCDVI